MTQPSGTELFATADEVAAKIGVLANTLPNGFATVEKCKIDFQYVGAYRAVQSDDTRGTAYIWRDAGGQPIAEVQIPDYTDQLRYKKINYDAAGVKTDHYEQLADGRNNTVKYHANGTPHTCVYVCEYGYDTAKLVNVYDDAGRLHNLAGYATYIKSDSYYFEEAYAIHGATLTADDFKNHPQRLAYQKEQSSGSRSRNWLRRIFDVHSEPPAAAPREGVLKVDQLIEIAAKLPEADKLRLLRAITNNVEEVSADSDLAKAVEGATVRITAPRVKGISRRSKP